MNGRPGMAAKVLALAEIGETTKGIALRIEASEDYVRATFAPQRIQIGEEMAETVDQGTVARVREAICAEITRQMGDESWSVPFRLDAVARAAAEAAVEPKRNIFA